MLGILGRALGRIHGVSLEKPLPEDLDWSPVHQQEVTTLPAEDELCSAAVDADARVAATRSHHVKNQQLSLAVCEQTNLTRTFDMKLVWIRFFDDLVRALTDTEATMFGGAACFLAQRQEFKKRLLKWWGDDETFLMSEEADYNTREIDPRNFKARTSLALPQDVDLWFLSRRGCEQTIHELTQKLQKSSPLTKLDLVAESDVTYSSSPFSALLTKITYRVSFDVFASFHTYGNWPVKLIEPVTFRLDCVFPADENLALFVTWPWQLAPYPNKAKCLGFKRGEIVLADPATVPKDMILQVSTAWQPFTDSRQEAKLWELWQCRQKSGAVSLVDREMACRRGIQSYILRLLKELCRGWILQDSPLLMEGDEIQLRSDSQQKQSVEAFLMTLDKWSENPLTLPNVVSLVSNAPHITWRCPWDGDGVSFIDLML
jgi:hypothetical protein